jgi:hypothetical protein
VLRRNDSGPARGRFCPDSGRSGGGPLATRGYSFTEWQSASSATRTDHRDVAKRKAHRSCPPATNTISRTVSGEAGRTESHSLGAGNGWLARMRRFAGFGPSGRNSSGSPDGRTISLSFCRTIARAWMAAVSQVKPLEFRGMKIQRQELLVLVPYLGGDPGTGDSWENRSWAGRFGRWASSPCFFGGRPCD